MVHPKIGTNVFAVRKEYADGERKTGRIVTGKIKTYQNIDGEIFPVIKETGSPREIDPRLHYIFMNQEDAIATLSPVQIKVKAKKNVRKK